MLYAEYQTLKTQHPNQVLLLERPDGYRAFDGDAQTLAAVTHRPCRKVTVNKRSVDTCIVPAADVDAAITALLEHGYTVAVAQPVSQPEPARPVSIVTTGESEAVPCA